MFKDRKIIHFAFTVLSLLYIIYVVSLGDSRMLGDEIGGDPGGMIIPLILGIFLFLSSAYIFITDKKTAKAQAMSPVEKSLFAGVVLSAILYVLLARVLGFIISTSLLLYVLIFLNLRQGLRKDDAKAFFIGFACSEVSLIGVYSVCRFITRSLTIAGRQGSLPAFLSSSGVILFIALLAATVLITVLALLFKKIKSKSELSNQVYLCALITVISTEAFYLIFKQLFLVNLIQGLITW